MHASGESRGHSLNARCGHSLSLCRGSRSMAGTELLFSALCGREYGVSFHLASVPINAMILPHKPGFYGVAVSLRLAFDLRGLARQCVTKQPVTSLLRP
jgi:hypothetical protein